MTQSIKISLFSICISMLLFVCGCSSGDHGMYLTPEPGQELPVQASISDVGAGVSEGKLFGFMGYKASMSATYTIGSVSDDGSAQAILSFERFNLDSIYEFDMGGRKGSEISQEVTDKLAQEPVEAKLTNTSELAVVQPVAIAILKFKEIVMASSAEKAYDMATFLYAEKLIQSIYSFPGKLNKGFKWEDKIALEIPNAYGETTRENIALNWELLRFNEKEATFFASGRSTFPDPQFKASDTNKTDTRRQFGINLVIDRTNQWIKRGTIDIREEIANIVTEIRGEDETPEDIRKPIKVRNIKIRYGKETEQTD